QNAHLVMAGMFSGVMLAQANDLAGKITALGGAVTSMVMAFAVAPGPPGLVLAALTGIATVIGTIIGKSKETEEAAGVNIDYAASVDAITAAMEGLGSAHLGGQELLEIFTDELSRLDSSNVSILRHNLESLGFTMSDLVAAFEGGGSATRAFSEDLADTFAADVLAGQIRGFRVEVERLDRGAFHSIEADITDLGRVLEEEGVTKFKLL